jgi:hypothetical protein
MGTNPWTRRVVVTWARLLASACRLAAGPGVREWRWCACLRAVAVGAAVALCTGMLAATPAQAAPGGMARAGLPAAALPPPLRNPGGDFVVTMPYSGLTQAAASQLVTTTLPKVLSLPANPTLSTFMTATYQANKAAVTAATARSIGAPPSFTGGSVSVSPTSVTVDVPGDALPPDSVNNPEGPAAQEAAAAVNTATLFTALIGCGSFVAATQKLATTDKGLPDFTGKQVLFCMSLAYAAAAADTAALIDTWFGTQLDSNQWAQIFVNVMTSGIASGWLTTWITPYLLQAGIYTGKKAASGLTYAITAGLWRWFPLYAVILTDAGVIATQATNSATAGVWNPVGSALKLPTINAAGQVFDNSLSSTRECADAWQADGFPVNGQKAAINACNGSQDQKWIQWSNNTLSNDGMCLDITGNSWWWGAPLELYVCNGQANQVWREYLNANYAGGIQNPRTGYCMDDPNWNEDPGTQLQDWWCHGESAQYWVLPYASGQAGTSPTVTDFGPVDSGLVGECMDAYGSSDGASPGQVVAINNCDGNLAQDWTVWSDGTVRAWNLCMDTSGSGSGAKVELEDCDGAASQVWTAQSNGELVNKRSGLCLEDPGATTAGTQLVLDTCNGAADERWVLPGPPPYGTLPPSSGESVCDIYASDGTPCVAAYSMTRAMYGGYDGPLYQVKRASDGTTANIGLLATGGDVNASEQDSFCAGTLCTITEIYDQSPEGNNLTIEQGGGANHTPDHGAVADALPIKIGGHEAYGLDIEPGTGYRDDSTHGIATGSQPEGMYMVASGTHVNSLCCFDFGNAETNNMDNNYGHMDAVNLTTWCGRNSQPCNASGGPWVEADMENGQWMGDGPNPGDTGNSSDFVTAMLKNNGQNTFELEGGDSTSGGLRTWYDGSLPVQYEPMHKEGAIVLGTGGDNSNADIGSFFEGVMTAGYPSDAADAAVQADIVAAEYSGNSDPASSTPASAAGQAVVHSAGATGRGASGFSSVYTVDSANGHLQETYLPYMGDSWTTQDLSAKYHTPPTVTTRPPSCIRPGRPARHRAAATPASTPSMIPAGTCRRPICPTWASPVTRGSPRI